MSFRRRRKKKDRRRFRGVYLLPNLITTGSLFAGFYAIVASMDGRFYAAAWALLVSMILDGLDGRIARMTKSTSGFGMQYDSLADLVAFGVAPGIMVYLWALKDFKQFGWAAAFLFVNLAAQAVRERGAFYVALAGGTTPLSCYRLLSAPLISSRVDWEKTQVFFGDERCVPEGHPDRNDDAAAAVLLNHVSLPGRNIHRISTMERDGAELEEQPRERNRDADEHEGLIPEELARLVVEAVVSYLNGVKQIDKVIYTAPVLITKENVDKYYDPKALF